MEGGRLCEGLPAYASCAARWALLSVIRACPVGSAMTRGNARCASESAHKHVSGAWPLPNRRAMLKSKGHKHSQRRRPSATTCEVCLEDCLGPLARAPRMRCTLRKTVNFTMPARRRVPPGRTKNKACVPNIPSRIAEWFRKIVGELDRVFMQVVKHPPDPVHPLLASRRIVHTVPEVCAETGIGPHAVLLEPSSNEA